MAMYHWLSRIDGYRDENSDVHERIDQQLFFFHCHTILVNKIMIKDFEFHHSAGP